MSTGPGVRGPRGCRTPCCGRSARATPSSRRSSSWPRAIRLGVFARGEQLPPERELAERLGVSRSTLREAIAALRDVGPGHDPSRARRRHRRGLRAGASPEHAGGPVRSGAALADAAELPAGRRAGGGAGSPPRARSPRTSGPGSRPRRAAVREAADPAAHRVADSRLHLAIATLSGSPMLIEAVTRAQAALHELLAAIPVLPLNIEHSDEQHEAVVGGGPRGRRRPRPGPPWRSTATRRPRCCAGCWAEDRNRATDKETTMTAPPALTVERADADDRGRRRSTPSIVRLHRHAGTPAGQADPRASSSSTRCSSTAPRGATTCSRSTST